MPTVPIIDTIKMKILSILDHLKLEETPELIPFNIQKNCWFGMEKSY